MFYIEIRHVFVLYMYQSSVNFLDMLFLKLVDYLNFTKVLTTIPYLNEQPNNWAFSFRRRMSNNVLACILF